MDQPSDRRRSSPRPNQTCRQRGRRRPVGWSILSLLGLVALMAPAVLAVMLIASQSQAATSKPTPQRAKIAVITARSGPLAPPSLPMIRALQMTQDRINGQGGVNLGDRSVMIDLLFFDGQSLPEKAGDLFQRLAKDRSILAVIGPHDSDSVRVLQDLAEPLALPVVNASGAALKPVPEGHDPWLVSIGLPADRYFSVVMEAISRGETRTPSIGLAYQNDQFGLAIRQGVLTQAQSFGIPVLFTTPLEDQGGIQAVDRLLATHSPTVMLFAANDPQMGQTMVRTLAQRKRNLDMMVMSNCASSDLARLGMIAEYILCPVQWDGLAPQSDPYWETSATFMSAYEVTFGEEPPYQAAQAATALVVLAKALERSGTLSRTDLHRTLGQTNLSTVFGPVRFGPQGRNTATQPLLEQIRGGSYMTVLPPERAWVPLVAKMPPWEDRLP